MYSNVQSIYKLRAIIQTFIEQNPNDSKVGYAKRVLESLEGLRIAKKEKV